MHWRDRKERLGEPGLVVWNVRICAMAFDQTVIRAPIAKIRVDTPYHVGEVNALCFREPICELIIGNISGAREPNDPNQT